MISSQAKAWKLANRFLIFKESNCQLLRVFSYSLITERTKSKDEKLLVYQNNSRAAFLQNIAKKFISASICAVSPFFFLVAITNGNFGASVFFLALIATSVSALKQAASLSNTIVVKIQLLECGTRCEFTLLSNKVVTVDIAKIKDQTPSKRKVSTKSGNPQRSYLLQIKNEFYLLKHEGAQHEKLFNSIIKGQEIDLSKHSNKTHFKVIQSADLH